MVGRFGQQVVVDDLGKAFDVDAVTFPGTVEPATSGIGRHFERFGQACHDVVAQKIHSVALFFPGIAIEFGKGLLEDVEAALGNQVALHVGNVGGITGVAQLFIEDAQEHLQDRVPLGFVVSFGINVEQDDVGSALGRTLNVGQQHGVFDLLEIKKLVGSPFLASLGVVCFQVFQQVRKDFDEVRLARTEEARHPHAHPLRDRSIIGTVHRRQVSIKKAAQVIADLLGDNVLLQLLPYAGGIHLVGFDDAVDRAVDGLKK
ncbi:hypothetical protein IWX85_001193 [Polaromonas sp. CG_9.11]|nr:hypothetical protein [Polaromonas sp. CG_9.11]